VLITIFCYTARITFGHPK